jgi:hypothetical protein
MSAAPVVPPGGTTDVRRIGWGWQGAGCATRRHLGRRKVGIRPTAGWLCHPAAQPRRHNPAGTTPLAQPRWHHPAATTPVRHVPQLLRGPPWYLRLAAGMLQDLHEVFDLLCTGDPEAPVHGEERHAADAQSLGQAEVGTDVVRVGI